MGPIIVVAQEVSFLPENFGQAATPIRLRV